MKKGMGFLCGDFSGLFTYNFVIFKFYYDQNIFLFFKLTF